MLMQAITFRTHQLYDIRTANAVRELFLWQPTQFPAIDFGFRLSCKQISEEDGLDNRPRWYPTRPLVVSAGPDMHFGLYTPDTNDLHGDRPPDLAGRNPMWAAVQLDYRCGRVDARHWRAALDNILSIELGPAPTPEELRERLSRD